MIEMKMHWLEELVPFFWILQTLTVAVSLVRWNRHDVHCENCPNRQPCGQDERFNFGSVDQVFGDGYTFYSRRLLTLDLTQHASSITSSIVAVSLAILIVACKTRETAIALVLSSFAMSLSEGQLQTLESSVNPNATLITTQQENHKQSTEALKDITFGSIAGICGKVFEYPFDTIKVRLQSQPSAASPLSNVISNGASGITSSEIYYTGPLDCFRKSVASGGISSLYRGISAPLFGAAVETSSLFFSYRIAQEAVCMIAYPQARVDSENGGKKIILPLGALLFCGAASGAFTSLLLTPIELVKCQIQAGASSSSFHPGVNAHTQAHKSPLSVIASVYRNQGISGFWRGQMGTLIRESGGSAAWFGSYEGVGGFLKRRYPPKVNSMSEEQTPSPTPVWQQLIAGAIAGVSYNFLFYPADTIKSRMQTEAVVERGIVPGGGPSTATQSLPQPQKQSFMSVGKDLWREQGLKGMYRGCGITVARAAPASAIIFSIFEALRSRFG